MEKELCIEFGCQKFDNPQIDKIAEELLKNYQFYQRDKNEEIKNN